MKYIGSKSRIAADIVPILQNIINENGIKHYIEPHPTILFVFGSGKRRYT